MDVGFNRLARNPKSPYILISRVAKGVTWRTQPILHQNALQDTPTHNPTPSHHSKCSRQPSPNSPPQTRVRAPQSRQSASQRISPALAYTITRERKGRLQTHTHSPSKLLHSDSPSPSSHVPLAKSGVRPIQCARSKASMNEACCFRRAWDAARNSAHSLQDLWKQEILCAYERERGESS